MCLNVWGLLQRQKEPVKDVEEAKIVVDRDSDDDGWYCYLLRVGIVTYLVSGFC